MNSFEILSVNISERKGTVKKPVDSIVLNDRGIEGDAHAGTWHRQVSLLAVESIQKAEKIAKVKLPFGVFAENITTRGVELHKAGILDRFEGKGVVLEVTQIGKKCHASCAIRNLIGDCIMPIEGVFTRVISGGELKRGDVLKHVPKTFKIKVITLSDRVSAGIYEDKSGKLIIERTGSFFTEKKLRFKINPEIIPDEKKDFADLLEQSFGEGYDIIFTTGSTGIGTRDIAPEIVVSFIDKEIPGIMEMIRVKYGMENSNALLSRSIAGIKEKTLLFGLPGSPKAVTEYLNEIFGVLYHAVLMVHDINNHTLQ